MAKVLSLRTSLASLQIVKLSLGLSLGFVGGIGVVDSAGNEIYQYLIISEHLSMGRLHIRLETRNDIRRILVLLVGNLGLVVEVLSSQSLELLTGVLFAFCGCVVVAQSTFTRSILRQRMLNCLLGHTP